MERERVPWSEKKVRKGERWGLGEGEKGRNEEEEKAERRKQRDNGALGIRIMAGDINIPNGI
ncbi:hypothetical protein AMTR_s00059p00030890 [Amborella trichopoda]|uniref:Uncharacterized protein n=1 Tax=Amborella trichopoda TaxID=13333 RepID=U5DAN5_AMBTC|nr:hypothetical protein AMTR_s00059p00030890 [Amborella trichopoda]